MIRHWQARLTVAAFAVASLGVVGCSSDGDSDVASSTTPPRSAPLWGLPGTAALDSASTVELQAALDEWVDAGHLVGLTAAVVTPDGGWSGAAGVDGAGTALQADSALSIMSISKTFTSAEVLLLSSRGLVDLDKPITDYIEVPFDTQGATVRQLLAMRSGFPATTAEQDQAVMAADLDREWTVSAMLTTLPADAAQLGTVGGEPRYNSINYQLLAELVAKVTGQTFAESVRADLLDPAGLQRTWVQSGETPIAPLTVGGTTPYADIIDPAGPFMPSRSFASFAVGGGSMAADAADVARWGYLLYGGQAIDSALVKEMEADPQPEPNMGPYALGVLVDDYEGVTMLGHGGGGVDWPYTGVLQVFAGDAPISIAVLTPQPADFGEDIFEVFMQLYDIVAG